MAPTLATLPTELLTSIFLHTHIPAIRLVSRRFNDIASPYLIVSASVSFTSQSLAGLEQLANHAVFSKGVRKVDISVAYWDKLLAESRERFVEDASINLSQELEWMERAAAFGYDDTSSDDADGTGNMWDDEIIDGKGETVHSPVQELESGIDELAIADEGSSAVVKTREDGKGKGKGKGKPKKKEKENYEYVNESYGIPDEWTAVNSPEFCVNEATEKQQVILNAYEEYIKLFEDQENVMQNGDGIKRLVKALEKFQALRTIAIKDYPQVTSDAEEWSYAKRLSNRGLKKRCLRPSVFKGTFFTAMITSPPIHYISGLFTALSETAIRPTIFKITLTAPTNMRCIQLSTEELAAVTKTLSRAEVLQFCVQEWARKGSLAENNDRSHEELAGLCALSRAYFSSLHLKKITLSLGNYPCFHEFPKVSIGDFLTLPLVKPNLNSIDFTHMPFELREMRTLVASVKDALTSFEGQGLFLLDGLWKEGIEVLKDLGNLEYVELKYPTGGEFGDRWVRNMPVDEMENFVIGEREENPLEGWTEETD